MNSNLPEKWIDKIFDLLDQYYGDRWKKNFKNQDEIIIHKIMWENALKYLSYEQLKHGLSVARKYSLRDYQKPPNQVIFYHFCVGIKVPDVPRVTWKDKKKC